MTATLIAITFDQSTEDYLRREMPRTVIGQDMLEHLNSGSNQADLDVPLADLPDGNYILVIGTNLDKGLAAKFTIIDEKTRKTVFEKDLELQPLIKSARDQSDKFSDLVTMFMETQSMPEQDQAADGMKNILNSGRSDYLEGLLAPHIQENPELNATLLTVLDVVIYPALEKASKKHEPHDKVATKLIDQGNKNTLH